MTGMRTEQEMLRHARRKDFDGYSCPAIRMCPMCSTFLEHDAGCKHITCNCGYQFCFVCLQTWETGCDHFTNCNVAPIQNLEHYHEGTNEIIDTDISFSIWNCHVMRDY
ncbi:hypothetical protein KUTeg_015681 [Tegillarca granosa]|uniref:RBR-type E3 ubiquitin transferase n=1 Tax=Tegillarca granosa TaxID=220873 RepID=A0ABQ9END6_TEGGR|nr:hypothetical protein KUTeg_015681 [Tegillarca granosa]